MQGVAQNGQQGGGVASLILRNGLTKVGTNIGEWGGTLIQNTTIDGDSFAYTVTFNQTNLFRVLGRDFIGSSLPFVSDVQTTGQSYGTANGETQGRFFRGSLNINSRIFDIGYDESNNIYLTKPTDTSIVPISTRFALKIQSTGDFILNTASSIGFKDINGNYLLNFPVTVASAVNYLQVSNSASGNPVLLSSLGTDTNISFRVNPKGTGGIGVGINASAILTLKAGTATASTAPLKLTSGTSLATPEAGAVEFDGTDIFFTPSTTRYTFSFSNRNENITGNWTFSNPITLPNGTSANPSIIFTGAGSNTGIYSMGAGNFNLVSGGDTKVNISNNVTLGGTVGTIVLSRPTSVNANLNFGSGININFSTTTGSQLGTSSNQFLSFWGKTPIIQPTTGITGATRVGGGGTTVTTTDTFGGYTIAQLAAIIINTGLAA